MIHTVRFRRCRNRFFLLTLLLFIVATGCGVDTAPQPEPPPAEPSGPTAPSAPEPPTGEPPPAPAPFETIDMTAFEHSGLTLQQIFPCGNDTVLFFTAAISKEGTVSESIVAYSYSTREKRFRAASALLGNIAVYPQQVLDDGRVVLVTQDSESYDYTGLLYLDPLTLETETGPLPTFDFNTVLISPNRKYAAFSSYDGITVMDISLQKQLFRLDSRLIYGDTGENEPVDMMMPTATAWAADSSALTYLQTALGDAYSSGIIRADTWQAEELPALKQAALYFLDADRLFYTDCYYTLPAGLYSLSQNQLITPSIQPELPESADASAIAISPSGAMMCVSVINAQDENNISYSAVVLDSFTGREVGKLTMESGPRFGSFEQVFFSPDERLVYLVASASLNQPRVVYTYYLEQ